MDFTSQLPWIGFTAFILVMLALDLGVFNRGAHEVSVKEAGRWVVAWVALAALFGLGLYVVQGSEPALEFFTGYVIEYSLSMDNIFVFVLIFTSFAVPAAYQHRVLFWGILGALVMRAAMIFAGATLIERFHWIMYLFGAFLVVSGVRMALGGIEEIHPERNPVVNLARRVLPVTPDYVGQHFFVRNAGRLLATPLLIVLVMVETTDLIFAVDSIPAIFAVTQDPFIIYTSNVFAILGLRSLYFVLRGAVDRFHYLRHALAGVLTFVGAKMLLADIYKIPTVAALLVIVGLLGIALAASLLRERRLAGASTPQSAPVREP
ncbi:MAG: TerC family protein [Thermomicrobiales bacterium]|nr:TerC family protein [Thermomicrobiales bacterium]